VFLTKLTHLAPGFSDKFKNFRLSDQKPVEADNLTYIRLLRSTADGQGVARNDKRMNGVMNPRVSLRGALFSDEAI